MAVPSKRRCAGLKRNHAEHSDAAARRAGKRAEKATRLSGAGVPQDRSPAPVQIDAAAVGAAVAGIMQRSFEATYPEAASAEVAD